jgi:hypothetical protein
MATKPVATLAEKFGKFIIATAKGAKNVSGRVITKPGRMGEDFAKGLGVGPLRVKNPPVRGPGGRMLSGGEKMTKTGIAAQGAGYGLGYGAPITLGYQLMGGNSSADPAAAPAGVPNTVGTPRVANGVVDENGIPQEESDAIEQINQKFLAGTRSMNPARYSAIEKMAPWALAAAERMSEDEFLTMRNELVSGKRKAADVHKAMANRVAHDLEASRDIGTKPYALPGVEYDAQGKNGRVVMIVPVKGKDGRYSYTYTSVPIEE